VGVALSDLAASHRCDGVGQTCNRGPGIAKVPPPLALAITPAGTTHNRHTMDALAAESPLPTWRSFLRNHLPDIAAIDMFVVATAMFQLSLYLDRAQPRLAFRPNDRGVSEGHCTALSAAGPGQSV